MIEDTLKPETAKKTVTVPCSPKDIHDRFTARVPPKCQITGVSLFCVQENRRQILCLIDIAGVSSNAAALALDGQPFGFGSVVVTLPVGADFLCRNRCADGTLPEHCACTPAAGNTIGRTAFD